jgi:DNA polymerase V
MLSSQFLKFVPYEAHLLPLYSCPVSAGFPSPADDHLDQDIDLNQHLIPHPSATFLVYADGHSMVEAGIQHGDLLIVDRSMEPRDGKIVVVAIDGELTVKRIRRQGCRIRLESANPDYPSIEVREGQSLIVWGVIIHVIHTV